MANPIPNSVIGAVSSVLAAYYYSHSTLNSLFMESGAPGDVPEGNCETKCARWLKRCNDDPSVDALLVLGQVIQKFMDQEPSHFIRPEIAEGQKRIKESLSKNQLSYQTNGFVTLAGASPATKTLADFLKVGDYASIEVEFDRAVAQLDRDPHAAITAASSIIEALCKTYIETFRLEMPNKQTIVPLWRSVQMHLGLNIDPTLDEDQKKILQGLSSIVDGIGAYRTHIGSAHGRGIAPPEIQVSEARLAVNASHTLVIFIMERWHACKTQNSSFNWAAYGGR
ncbi:MAG: abortive infection family protein [Trichlorobacter sp.]|uniref:abortive infection family protein n=1 Tax=Trichlorobacter sp. TaxID=2911007 RepID=UPI00256121B9|nr:abortive infection family protein [Trichlorobacter sp.]MDK9716893.1 abortive infection family protein [Trichlorobacter sp.]